MTFQSSPRARVQATISTKDVIEFITENVPELVIGKPSFQFDQQGGGEGFSVQLSGDSTELLNELSFEVERILETIDGLTDVISDADTGAPEIQITVDRERAMAVGLNTELVAQFVSLAPIRLAQDCVCGGGLHSRSTSDDPTISPTASDDVGIYPGRHSGRGHVHHADQPPTSSRN